MASKIMISNRKCIKMLKIPWSSAVTQQHRRNLFEITDLSKIRKEFNEKKLVGFSMEQLYDVVADVENYHSFVPFCKKSLVYSKQVNFLKADLVVGFPPIQESYTSNVTLSKPELVKAECNDGKIFNYLLTMWKFSPGLKDIPQSCVVDFHVAFEFKSIIHTQLSLLFFDQLVKQMEEAFFKEARHRYGQPSITTHILVKNKS